VPQRTDPCRGGHSCFALQPQNVVAGGLPMRRCPCAKYGFDRQYLAHEPSPDASMTVLHSSSITPTSRALILDRVRAEGPVSRVELAERTGLTQASISNLVRSLLVEGLLVETGERTY